MVTTKINLQEHLIEYCTGKFNHCTPGPVQFPARLDIYHVIFDLLERRPANCPIDYGNFEIVLPARDVGKRPETYNYLGQRSELIIAKRIELMMWAELHDYLDEQKHQYGYLYVTSVHSFMRKYDIRSLTEDAFLKNYYRWRDRVRHKEKKREYARK